jgi:hypothetical protein
MSDAPPPPPSMDLKTLFPNGTRGNLGGSPVRVLAVTRDKRGSVVIYENLQTQARGWVQGWYFRAQFTAS